MTELNYASRDDAIRINSYTTVLRRDGVPHEVFATYWRDAHGPLCSRVPGLGWYVQNHFSREQDAHLWPLVDGVTAIPGYVLDGGVEIGFANSDDQATFQAASPILFSDEQNMFAETIAYALPRGSRTFVDRLANPSPNETDTLDRMHVHFSPAHDDAQGFQAFMAELAQTLASDPAVLKLRLHLPDPYDNAKPSPPAPDVAHTAPADRIRLAIMEIAFATPLARRTFFASDAFKATAHGRRRHIRHASAFAVSGVHTYVRDGKLTLAGLRGSRTAELITTLGALNQAAPDVKHLIQYGVMAARAEGA
jgi:hypothetical protein